MINVITVVERIIEEDLFAREAIERGLLNLTAYAQEILPIVESETKKPVKLGTIVVALSRLRISLLSKDNLLSPIVHIDSMSISSSLSEITYELTEKVSRDAQRVEGGEVNSFFTITKGLHELTIICPADAKEKVKSYFTTSPKIEMENLVAISLRFSSDYIAIPNAIYSLVGILANSQINLMEIISTYTELTFIIKEVELERAIQTLTRYAQK